MIIAIKMLIGDKSKYLALVFGVAFATLLIAQQASLFTGLMARTAAVINDVTENDIWVMDKRVRYIEEVTPMRDIELANVRSVPGVLWAVPFYKGLAIMTTPDGYVQQVQLIGVDEISLIGMCPEVLMGDYTELREPQSAMIDRNGFIFTWPGQKLHIGKHVEINDNRVKINAICNASATFITYPTLYISYKYALTILPPSRNNMSYILVKGRPGANIKELAKQIEKTTQLQALTNNDFAWRSIHYVLTKTGVPINFGITVLLGILIGGAITAQTFYIFVIENLRQFGTMKAIGLSNSQILRMVFAQAALIMSLGYSIGIGFTALFFRATKNITSFKGFYLRFDISLGVFLMISIIIIFATIFSLRRVFNVDPGLVFRG